MSIFYAHLKRIISQGYKAVTPLGCSYLNVCALFLAELEATAFFILKLLILKCQEQEVIERARSIVMFHLRPATKRPIK